MNSIEIQFEEKCQLCENTKDLLDTWEEDFSHIHEKLDAVTDSQNQETWLRFICIYCKEKLDELWEFRNLCKYAHDKLLAEIKEITEDLMDESEDIVEGNMIVSNEDQTNKEIKHFEVFKTVIPEGSNEIENFVEDFLEFDVPIDQIIVCEDPEDVDESQEAPITDIHVQETKIEDIPISVEAEIGNMMSKTEESTTCSICNKTYTSKANLTQHINIIHKKITPYECSFCDKKFATRYRIEQHQEVHIKNRTRLPCDFCNQSFTSESNKRRHINEVHKESSKRRSNKSLCKVCGATFETKTEYYQHMDSHPGTRIRRIGLELKCQFCCKEFKSYQAVKAHERVHTGEKPFVCEICSKAFRQDSHLHTHMNVHKGKRKYPCDYCDKVFTEHKARKVHERIHSVEESFEEVQ